MHNADADQTEKYSEVTFTTAYHKVYDIQFKRNHTPGKLKGIASQVAPLS